MLNETCSLEELLAFSMLARLGYKVVRHQVNCWTFNCGNNKVRFGHNYPLSLINLFDNWSPSAKIGTPVVLLVSEVLMFSISPNCLNVTHKSKANAHSMEFCFILGRSGNNFLREADQTWSLSGKEKKRPQVKFFSWF